MSTTFRKQDVNFEELNVTIDLIVSMNRLYKPELYHDEYQMKLKEFLKSRIEGQDFVVADEKSLNIINLMDALKVSVKKQHQEFKPVAKKTSRKKARKPRSNAGADISAEDKLSSKCKPVCHSEDASGGTVSERIL